MFSEVHHEVAGGLGGPRPGRVGGDACKMDAAGSDFDNEQNVEPAKHRGVDAREVSSEDRVRL